MPDTKTKWRVLRNSFTVIYSCRNHERQ